MKTPTIKDLAAARKVAAERRFRAKDEAAYREYCYREFYAPSL